jgi:hypothetical protein
VSGVRGERELLSVFAAWVAGIGFAGLGCAAFLVRQPSSRLGALLGVAASLLSGLIALSLKKWALDRSLQLALGMIGVSFLLRLTFLGVGVAVAHAKAAGLLPFTAGFFGVYFPLQWVEIGYILAESKRRAG